MTAEIVLFRLDDCMLSAAGANRIRYTRYAAPLHHFFFYYVSLIAHLPSHHKKRERERDPCK